MYFFLIGLILSYQTVQIPDEMLHHVAFYLGLHCLPKYSFRGFWSKKGLKPCFNQSKLLIGTLLIQKCILNNEATINP